MGESLHTTSLVMGSSIYKKDLCFTTDPQTVENGRLGDSAVAKTNAKLKRHIRRSVRCVGIFRRFRPRRVVKTRVRPKPSPIHASTDKRSRLPTFGAKERAEQSRAIAPIRVVLCKIRSTRNSAKICTDWTECAIRCRSKWKIANNNKPINRRVNGTIESLIAYLVISVFSFQLEFSRLKDSPSRCTENSLIDAKSNLSTLHVILLDKHLVNGYERKDFDHKKKKKGLIGIQ